MPLGDISGVQRLGQDSASFRVKAPQRAYEFRAPSPEEAADWIAALTAAADAARTARGGKARMPATAAMAVGLPSKAPRGGFLGSLLRPQRHERRTPTHAPSLPPTHEEPDPASHGDAPVSPVEATAAELPVETVSRPTGRTRLLGIGRRGGERGNGHAVAAPVVALAKRDSWEDINLATTPEESAQALVAAGMPREQIDVGRFSRDCEESMASGSLERDVSTGMVAVATQL